MKLPVGGSRPSLQESWLNLAWPQLPERCGGLCKATSEAFGIEAGRASRSRAVKAFVFQRRFYLGIFAFALLLGLMGSQSPGQAVPSFNH